VNPITYLNFFKDTSEVQNLQQYSPHLNA